MQKSQELLENKDFDGALEVLTSPIESGKLSDYEKSNVYRYIGSSYHSAGDISSAKLFARLETSIYKADLPDSAVDAY